MHAKELQKLIEQMGLSQRRAARELNINERTMRKYVAGDSLIPKTVALALTHLRIDREHELLLEELQEARDEMHAPFAQTRRKMSAIANGTSTENPTLKEIRTASDAMERFDRARRRLRQFFADSKAIYAG